MIRFEEVSFGYDRRTPILENVCADLDLGLTLLLGPNGCGKSTLLKLAAGVEKPWRGRVTLEGHDLWRDEVTARSGSAYVPEHPDLTPYATVREILTLVAGLRREPPGAVHAALRWVGLEDLSSRTVRELSKGQRRRAVTAAARIGAPRYLLLDEPLEGVDRSFRSQLVEWIAERRAAGACIVVVSHDIEALSGLADRAATIVEGRARLLETLSAEPGRRLNQLDHLAQGRSPESAVDPY
jgi:ABC-type multidrug transport system ATPase subunit